MEIFILLLLLIFNKFVFSYYYIIKNDTIDEIYPDIEDYQESWVKYTNDSPYERIRLNVLYILNSFHLYFIIKYIMMFLLIKMECYILMKEYLLNIIQLSCISYLCISYDYYNYHYNNIIAGLSADFDSINSTKILYKSTEDEFTIIYFNTTLYNISDLLYTFSITLYPSGTINLKYYNIYTLQQIRDKNLIDKLYYINTLGESWFWIGIRPNNIYAFDNPILSYLNFEYEYPLLPRPGNYIPIDWWGNFTSFSFIPISKQWCIYPVKINYTNGGIITFFGDFINNENIDEYEKVIKIMCYVLNDNELLLYKSDGMYKKYIQNIK